MKIVSFEIVSKSIWFSFSLTATGERPRFGCLLRSSALHKVRSSKFAYKSPDAFLN